MAIYPWMIDAILIAVIIEFLVLSAVLKKFSAHDLIAPLFFFLLSGGLLLSALRLALSGSSSTLIALTLLCAFFSHAGLLILMFQRLRKS